MNEEKEFYEGVDEEELVEGFIEKLEKDYDITPYGVGDALAFLYNNISILKEKRK